MCEASEVKIKTDEIYFLTKQRDNFHPLFTCQLLAFFTFPIRTLRFRLQNGVDSVLPRLCLSLICYTSIISLTPSFSCFVLTPFLLAFVFLCQGHHFWRNGPVKGSGKTAALNKRSLRTRMVYTTIPVP